MELKRKGALSRREGELVKVTNKRLHAETKSPTCNVNVWLLYLVLFSAFGPHTNVYLLWDREDGNYECSLPDLGAANQNKNYSNKTPTQLKHNTFFAPTYHSTEITNSYWLEHKTNVSWSLDLFSRGLARRQ